MTTTTVDQQGAGRNYATNQRPRGGLRGGVGSWSEDKGHGGQSEVEEDGWLWRPVKREQLKEEFDIKSDFLFLVGYSLKIILIC